MNRHCKTEAIFIIINDCILPNVVVTIFNIIFFCKWLTEFFTLAFRIDLLMGACTVLALLSTHRNWTILPILWHFGVFLEAFALFPQIHLTARTRYVGSSLLFYVGMIACYRAFHIVHWLYLLSRGEHLENYYVAICGFGQFFICCGYFGWMLPIFKAQYAHLKDVDEGQPRVMAVVAVRVNGNLDVAENATKSEASTND